MNQIYHLALLKNLEITPRGKAKSSRIRSPKPGKSRVLNRRQDQAS